jgi:hypothetical protein
MVWLHLWGSLLDVASVESDWWWGGWGFQIVECRHLKLSVSKEMLLKVATFHFVLVLSRTIKDNGGIFAGCGAFGAPAEGRAKSPSREIRRTPQKTTACIERGVGGLRPPRAKRANSTGQRNTPDPPKDHRMYAARSLAMKNGRIQVELAKLARVPPTGRTRKPVNPMQPI